MKSVKNHNPAFIVVESVTHAGKTTLVGGLTEALKKEGIPVMLNQEPTSNNVFGMLVRLMTDHISLDNIHLNQVIEDLGKSSFSWGPSNAFYDMLHLIMNKISRKEPLDFLEKQTLFMADRRMDLEHIILKRLGWGISTIQDRYQWSTNVYGMMQGISLHTINHWREIIIGDKYCVPDLTIYIDVPVETVIHRMKISKKHFDENETKGKIERTIDTYCSCIDLAKEKNERVVIVDGNAPPEAVLQYTKEAVMSLWR